MSALRHFLHERARVLQRKEASASEPVVVHATARVQTEGDSGIRRIRIRDFSLLSDLGPDCAGYDLGPTPFELQLGALGSCLMQTVRCQAVEQGIPVDVVDVEVSGDLVRPCTGGSPDAVSHPRDLRFTIHLTSPATPEQIAELQQAVEQRSTILNLLVQSQAIQGTIVHEIGPTTDDRPLVN